MVLAASPAVAERIHVVARHVHPQAVGVPRRSPALIVVGVSLLPPRDVRRLALLGCVVALALTAMTLVVGVETKGARRWISIAGIRIQPSEFLKPCFALAAAWLLAEGTQMPRFPGTSDRARGRSC